MQSNNVAFQILITFPSLASKTSHIPSQQESNHFLLLLMLNSGKWPQIFCHIQRNHPKKSKCRDCCPSRLGLVKKVGCSTVIGLTNIFLSLIFFHLVIARQPSAPLAERMAEDKEIGCSVGFMQNCSPRIYICPDFVGFPLIARNLASILWTLHSHKIQVVLLRLAIDILSSSPFLKECPHYWL